MTTKRPSDDIVERLRETEARGIFEAVEAGVYVSPGEAADEITRLRAENAELQRKLDNDLGLALAVAMYGPGFDPFTNPEVLDFCEKLAATALTSIRGEA